MCGRYSNTLTPAEIKASYGIEQLYIPGLEPNYNIAPTQQAWVVTQQDTLQLQPMHWGLVPRWVKQPELNGKLINARAETVLEKPSFAESVRYRRCLIPADSFYEWKREGSIKQPYRITPAAGGTLTFAGIWDTAIHPQNAQQHLTTFSILTVAPNREMAQVHNRMPLVLAKAEQEAWLSDLATPDLSALLTTPPDGILHMYPSNRAINKVSARGAHLHQPNDKPRQGSLFG